MAAEAVRRAKDEGVRATAGVSINHLSLNELDVGEYRTFFRLSPPLRSEEDRTAMIDGLRDGTIDIIVSSHDPQDVDTKRLPFADAAAGAIGLETLLAAALRLHHDGSMPLLRLVEALSTGPARLFGLPCGKLAPGSPADLILVDLDAPWIVREADIRSRSKNTAFEGARMQGRVLQTMVGGRTVFSCVETA
jgi:dihydroorotase